MSNLRKGHDTLSSLGVEAHSFPVSDSEYPFLCSYLDADWLDVPCRRLQLMLQGVSLGCPRDDPDGGHRGHRPQPPYRKSDQRRGRTTSGYVSSTTLRSVVSHLGGFRNMDIEKK